MVVAIIAVLIALLLPAVQSARGGAAASIARRTCSSSASRWATTPPRTASSRPAWSTARARSRTCPGGYHVGWAVQILPFIEQGNIYRHIDFRQGVYADANSTRLAHFIGVFLCPRDW